MGRLGKWGLAGVAAGSIVGVASGAIAQVPSPADMDAITRNQQQILQRQQDQQREIERRAREGAERSQSIPLHPVPQGLEGAGSGCVQVETIALEGASSLSQGERDALVAPFLGRCLTLGDLNEVLKAVSQRYIDKGLVAARPYLPAQDLQGGSLKIIVIEGEVESIDPAVEGSLGWANIATAFPGVIGAPLFLRDFEQGLDQINRLRSNNAQMTLEPGKRQGTTRVVIRNEPQKRWRVNATANNSGQSSTGRYKIQSSGEIDDLLGVNDYLSITVDRTSEYSESWRGSRSASGFFSVPYGYWTLSLSGNYYEYHSPLLGLSQPYHSWGTSKGWKASLERVLHRDGEGKTSATLQLRRYAASGHLNEIHLLSSSYDLTVVEAGVFHNRKLLGGVISASAAWDRGLDLWHAKDDDKTVPKTTPKAQFRKATADLSYVRPVDIAGIGVSISTALHGQWSPDTLYGSERISLGGETSVRGFETDYPTGDVGGTWRTEISVPLPTDTVPWLVQGVGRVSPFIAYDIGALRGDPKDDRERGVTSGVSLGVRASGGLLSWSATYSIPVRAPAYVRERDHEAYLSASLNF